MPASAADRDLVRRIRTGDEAAWRECIERFEGRLMAFVESRLRNRSLAEDLVQDTFIGFLTALPNYDEETPIEAFLFAITAHKITDEFRRQGRRPKLPLGARDGSDSPHEPAGNQRVASSIARSREQRGKEEAIVADCLSGLIQQWKERGDLLRLKCVELLFVKGLPNKEVAAMLGISEQDVANHKHFVVSKIKEAAKASALTDEDLERLGL